jgi:hypothetical protein
MTNSTVAPVRSASVPSEYESASANTTAVSPCLAKKSERV